MPRSEKMLVAAAAEWCRAARTKFGWSEADLVSESEKAARYLRFANAIPTVEDVEALEALQVKQLPRWLRSARYAAERVQLSREEMADWPGGRTWFRYDGEPADPFDCCYPLVFRDEYYFLEELNSMQEEDRRSLRRFVVDFRSPYKSRKEAVERLLSDLSVQFDQAPADESEAEVLAGMRNSSRYQKALLVALAKDPKMMTVLANNIMRMRDAEADVAEVVDALSRMDEAARQTVLMVARLGLAATR